MLLVAAFAQSQTCSLDICVNSPDAVIAADNSTGQPFDVSTYTITWTSTLTGFIPTTGNVNRIDWADVGSTPGVYSVEYTISGPGICDSTVSCTINVIDAAASINNAYVCRAGANQPLPTAFPPGGTYTIGGTPVTELTPSDVGQTLTYTAPNGNGCTGTASIIVQALPTPTGIIRRP